MGKCVFHLEWLSNPLYSEWLTEYKMDRYKAFCAVCKKDFSLGTMGEYALKSHVAGKAHKKNFSIVKQNTKIFVSDLSTPAPAAIALQDTPSATSASAPHQSPGPSRRTETSAAAMPSISHHFESNDILKAEVLWGMHTISRHSSYSSNENICSIFQSMFPDSMNASKFTCGASKTAYLAIFGLADFFKKALLHDIKGVFTVLFDESLNNKLKEKQTDLHVRYWCGSKNCVVTRYMCSEFLGKLLPTTIAINTTDLLCLSTRLDFR